MPITHKLFPSIRTSSWYCCIPLERLRQQVVAASLRKMLSDCQQA